MEITGGNGGLHGALKNVRREDCYLIDVDSFYPTIMVTFEWFPMCRRKERFAELLKLKRDGFKEAKLMINSVYGLLPEEIRIKICKKGQELMHELIDMTYGELIQVNTDGIIVKNPNFDAVEKWCSMHRMMTTTKHIKALVQKDVNNYAYIDDDDKLTIKGTLRTKGLAGRAVALALLTGTTIDSEIRKGTLGDYCETMNAEIYEYDGVLYVCDVVRYVHTTGDNVITINHIPYNNCRPVMGQLTGYDKQEYDIDYDYYCNIAKQVYTDWTGRRAR